MKFPWLVIFAAAVAGALLSQISTPREDTIICSNPFPPVIIKAYFGTNGGTSVTWGCAK